MVQIVGSTLSIFIDTKDHPLIDLSHRIQILATIVFHFDAHFWGWWIGLADTLHSLGVVYPTIRAPFYLNANVYNDVPHWTLTYCFPLTM